MTNQFEDNFQPLQSGAPSLSSTASADTSSAYARPDLWMEAILNSADFCIISTDTQGLIQTINAGALQKLGYEAQELIGKATPSLLHDAAEVEARAKELSAEMGLSIEPGFEVFVCKARRGQADENDWTYIRRDGTRFTVRLSVTAIRDENRQIVGFLGIGKDISKDIAAQRNTQNRLGESQERFQRLAEASFEGVFISRQGMVLDANPQGAEMFGYSLSELTGMDALLLIAPDERETVRAKIQQNDPTPYETIGRHKDGHLFPVLASGKQITLDGQEARVTAVRDITEQRRAQEELRASEERFRDLFNNASDLIQSVNPQGRFLYVNQSWLDTLQYTIEEVNALTIWDVIHPDCLIHCQRLFERIMSGEPLKRIEVTFLSKSGAPIMLEGSSSCLMQDGEAVATRAIFHDVTEQRHHAQQLEAYQRQLEGLVHRLEEMAVTDALTGLKNQGFFQQRLAEECSRVQRYGLPLALVLFDVDGFKAYNSDFGHPAGDEVLQKMGALTKECARVSDCAARIGGQLFALMMPSTNGEGAYIVAERLRRLIERSEWPHRRVTASFGISELHSQTEAVTQLQERAGQALYEAKNKGRNRTEIKIEANSN